jgi:membrane protease YdiL (CAAX protease family)
MASVGCLPKGSVIARLASQVRHPGVTTGRFPGLLGELPRAKLQASVAVEKGITHFKACIPLGELVLLGLFLGPILEESLFRGSLLPVLMLEFQ